jgi:hypothetical protein
MESGVRVPTKKRCGSPFAVQVSSLVDLAAVADNTFRPVASIGNQAGRKPGLAVSTSPNREQIA